MPPGQDDAVHEDEGAYGEQYHGSGCDPERPVEADDGRLDIRQHSLDVLDVAPDAGDGVKHHAALAQSVHDLGKDVGARRPSAQQLLDLGTDGVVGRVDGLLRHGHGLGPEAHVRVEQREGGVAQIQRRVDPVQAVRNRRGQVLDAVHDHQDGHDDDGEPRNQHRDPDPRHSHFSFPDQLLPVLDLLLFDGQGFGDDVQRLVAFIFCFGIGKAR